MATESSRNVKMCRKTTSIIRITQRKIDFFRDDRIQKRLPISYYIPSILYIFEMKSRIKSFLPISYICQQLQILNTYS